MKLLVSQSLHTWDFACCQLKNSSWPDYSHKQLSANYAMHQHRTNTCTHFHRDPHNSNKILWEHGFSPFKGKEQKPVEKGSTSSYVILWKTGFTGPLKKGIVIHPSYWKASVFTKWRCDCGFNPASTSIHSSKDVVPGSLMQKLQESC